MTDIQEVCTLVRRGGKVSIGRNHTGRLRLKVKSGPFGVFVNRFDITEEQLRMIKETLSLGPRRALRPAPGHILNSKPAA
jgi:hypothetical protein